MRKLQRQVQNGMYYIIIITEKGQYYLKKKVKLAKYTLLPKDSQYFKTVSMWNARLKPHCKYLAENSMLVFTNLILSLQDSHRDKYALLLIIEMFEKQ